MVANNETAVALWQIIAHHGYAHQKEKAVEELGELSAALARDLQGDGDRENIAEEMADVYIMLAQLELIFGNRPMIEEYIAMKIDRTLHEVEREREGEHDT